MYRELFSSNQVQRTGPGKSRPCQGKLWLGRPSERLREADGGGHDGESGGEAEDRDGPHDRAAPEEGAHPGKDKTDDLNPF